MKRVQRQQGFTQHHFCMDGSTQMVSKKRNMNSIKSGAGFTMIELIVYLGIATIALLVFYGFAADVMRAAARTKTTSDVQGNARVVMSRIMNDVRASSAAAAPGGQLTLTVGASPKCYFLETGAVKYYDCSNHATDSTLTDSSVNVSALTFNDASLPQIGIVVTVEPHIAGTADPVTLSTSVVPRSNIYL